MQTNMLRTSGPKDLIINQIIDREWKMFQDVESMGGRAQCQDDIDTFYIMRYSQHNILREETLKSYRDDLVGGDREGRNLIMEKYAYMMESTDPEYYYANIDGRIPKITKEKDLLIRDIGDAMQRHYGEFALKYPKYSSHGRSAESGGGETSTSVYLLGELKTYSLRTLRLFFEDIKYLNDQKQNPVELIQEIMSSFYGYDSIGDAEAKMH